MDLHHFPLFPRSPSVIIDTDPGAERDQSSRASDVAVPAISQEERGHGLSSIDAISRIAECRIPGRAPLHDIQPGSIR
jgi:hypothetical protein